MKKAEEDPQALLPAIEQDLCTTLRLADLDGRIDGLEASIESVEVKLEDHSSRTSRTFAAGVESIMQDMQTLSESLTRLLAEQAGHAGAIERLQADVVMLATVCERMEPPPRPSPHP